MKQSTLDLLLEGLFTRDRLLRVQTSVHDALPSLLELSSIRAWSSQSSPSSHKDAEKLAIERAVVASLLPESSASHPASLTSNSSTVTYAVPLTVRYESSSNYARSSSARTAHSACSSWALTAAEQEFYVHIPSWVKVSRAPFHTFGPNLFGLAYTSTGHVHIRDDLEGNEFAEVLQHEVFHQLYPNCSEGRIRQFTLARFGESAAIHHRIGPGI